MLSLKESCNMPLISWKSTPPFSQVYHPSSDKRSWDKLIVAMYVDTSNTIMDAVGYIEVYGDIKMITGTTHVTLHT